jgi:hypothetical protein
MTSIQLALPDEIISQIDFGTESFRDVSALVIAIDSLDVTAGVITLTGLRQQLPDLARAIRSWTMRRPRDVEPARLMVKGADFEIKLELPPNVQTAQIIDAISKLLVPASSGGKNRPNGSKG